MKKLIKYVFLFIMMIGLSACGKQSTNNGDNKKDEVSENKVRIVDMSVAAADGYVIALTSDNNLYALGSSSTGGFGLGDIETVKEPTVIATNVKYFESGGYNIYYIDNNNDFYYTGLAAIGQSDGGVINHFEKVYSNVKNISTFMPYCVGLTTNSNEAYIDSSKSIIGGNCGMEIVTDEFTFVNSDIQVMLTGFDYHGYIDNNGDVYFKTNHSDNYTKIYEGIGSVKLVYSAITSKYILTDDNCVYKISSTEDVANPYSFEKVLENIVDMGVDSLYFKDIDGNIYFVEDWRNQNSLIISQGNGYDKLNISGIDKLYYANHNDVIYIYLGIDGKLHLYSEVDKYDLEPTVDNLQKILDFVK